MGPEISKFVVEVDAATRAANIAATLAVLEGGPWSRERLIEVALVQCPVEFRAVVRFLMAIAEVEPDQSLAAVGGGDDALHAQAVIIFAFGQLALQVGQEAAIDALFASAPTA